MVLGGGHIYEMGLISKRGKMFMKDTNKRLQQAEVDDKRQF